MVEVEILQAIESNVPGMHLVRIQADDLETYSTIPFGIQGAIFQPNRDSQASDSWGVTFTAGETTLTVRLTGTTTNVNGTLMILGQ